MNGDGSEPPSAWGEVAAGIAEQRQAVASGRADVDRLHRSIRKLERLLLRTSGDDAAPGIGAADRLILQDEVMRLRDALAGDLSRMRRALDQDRRHQRATLLYRQGGA